MCCKTTPVARIDVAYSRSDQVKATLGPSTVVWCFGAPPGRATLTLTTLALSIQQLLLVH
jgi:hypothetical protein